MGAHDIKLTPIGWEGYKALFDQMPYSTLLQSPVYAKTVRLVYYQTSIPYRIDKNDKTTGICVLHEASALKRKLQAIMLDRGPLWYDPPPSQGDAARFFKKINDLYPPRFGRKRRFLPELENTLAYGSALNHAGLKRLKNRPGYQTYWLDLQAEEQSLRSALKGKWRNALRKAEKSELELCWGKKIEDAAIILSYHNQDKQTRQFRGASLKTLSVLCHQAAISGDLLSGVAKQNGGIVGGVIFIRHGRAATYQVGWSHEAGREVNASNILLWQGMLKLKDAGAEFLDIGGVNEKDAQGVKRFKSGLGGDFVELLGHYK